MIKDMGQNFLVDEDVLQDVIGAAELTPDDVVLEIGAGNGVLTAALLEQTKNVTTVELDRSLVDGLKERFVAQENLTIVNADALEWIPRNKDMFEDRQWKVVANLPYGITSRVLRLFVEHEPRPSLIVVMIQREVAERVCAKPGDMSLLSLAVQWFGVPEIIRTVSPESFDPAPTVESAILRIRLHDAAALTEDSVLEKRVFQLARIGFASRRKQLHNQLATGLQMLPEDIRRILGERGIGEKARAQELSVDDWKNLAKTLS